MPQAMSRKLLLILVTVGTVLLLCIYTPIVPIVYHLTTHTIAAVAPAQPFDGPHTFHLRIDGTPVFGGADDTELWFAVVPIGPEVSLSNTARTHSQPDPRRPNHPHLSINTDRNNLLELDGVPVSIPSPSNVFAIDRHGETHPIHMDTSTIADMIRIGSSRSSIPPTMSIGPRSEFASVCNAVQRDH